jgi:hypothetical protein
MARVTPTEVKEIMDNCEVLDSIVVSIIDTANAFVTDTFFDDQSLSATRLKDIEKWLTAHMIASSLERQTSQEKVGDGEVTYSGKWADGIKSTTYGQMVLFLDTTGKIANSGKQGASIKAIKSDRRQTNNYGDNWNYW